MRMNKNIDLWLKDARFCEFASRRMYQILHDPTHHAGSRDKVHARMVRQMASDKRHLYAYVPYMTFKLNAALLIDNRKQRMNRLLWVWKQLVRDLSLLKFQLEGDLESLCFQSYQYVLVGLHEEFVVMQNKRYIRSC